MTAAKKRRLEAAGFEVGSVDEFLASISTKPGREAMQAQKAIAEGIVSMERGEGQPAETVFTRLRKKYGFKSSR